MVGTPSCESAQIMIIIIHSYYQNQARIHYVLYSNQNARLAHTHFSTHGTAIVLTWKQIYMSNMLQTHLFGV